MNMNSNATIKKLIQVTEEAQAPIHIPILLGNECYIVTQQDVRRIEDTRLLKYSKVTATGEVIPLDVLSHDGQAILNACRCRMQMEQNANINNQAAAAAAATIDANAALAELIARASGGGGRMLTMDMACGGGGIAVQQQQPAQMASTAATLEQQLQWAKVANNTSAAFPFTNTTATSTSEIPGRSVRFQQDDDGSSGAKCCCCCCRNNCNSSCRNRGCNTMEVDDETLKATDGKNGGGGCLCARAQLKQKKIKQALGCIS